ncbi:MAG: hypothetical protein B7Z66_00525 [Chromatiales bacterium 21-64-14]|nr:MAG: hypothetical protein B7Z66_00525 [Chromatiales bacterium 21-64-14]HQU15514.1 EAL domain-containing protein [Gammaproteobacteria bacterium]
MKFETRDRGGRGVTWAASLTLKISGIVFWGNLLVGLLIALVLLHGLEAQIIEQYQTEADSFAYRMDTYVHGHPEASFDQVAAEARRLRHRFRVPAVELQAGTRQVHVGAGAAGLTAYLRVVPYRFATGSGVPPFMTLRIYRTDLRDAIAAQRKRVLISVALAFLLLGFVLQWILQRVLTRPFLRMVGTAQGFSRGDTDLRFDEQRDDEFGYLARFINKALDFLILQQEDLRDALKRVRQSEAALFREKERAEVTLHSIGDAVVTTDAHGSIDYLNPVAQKLTGWSVGEVRGQPISELMRVVNEHSGVELRNPVEHCLAEGRIVELPPHCVLLCANGRSMPIADSAAPIHDRQGHTLGAVMVFHDVSHARQLERELSYHASYDSLTGLCNRRQFEVELHRALETAAADGSAHALCYLDLDQFKVVNDTCGHVAGDELLRQLAAQLARKVRDTDILSRLGGDEFGLLLYGCNMERAHAIADGLRAVVQDFRFSWEDHSFQVGASIGVATISSESHGVAEIMSAADVACYAAKEHGRNRVHLYQPGDLELQQRRGEMRLVARINQALDDDRLRLYCQEIVPVGSRRTVVHRELLVRMVDKDGTILPPMSFIPAAERYNLMQPLDRWVVKAACRRIAQEPNGGNGGIWAINLSGQSICDEAFLEFIMGTVDDYGIAPEQLCFEITETAAIANLSRATRFMNVLHGMGCRFALDDFGSGLSSFAYLKQLPVDYLKIDGGFVRDMTEDPIDHAMVEAINHIGHVMGIQTIAEFVEDAAILEALRALQVDFAQGYWIAKPLPLEDADLGPVPGTVLLPGAG